MLREGLAVSVVCACVCVCVTDCDHALCGSCSQCSVCMCVRVCN